jgi:hypothetical protein
MLGRQSSLNEACLQLEPRQWRKVIRHSHSTSRADMVTESLDVTPVENIQSSDNLGLLDVIDSSLEVSHYVSLPQIIFFGINRLARAHGTHWLLISLSENAQLCLIPIPTIVERPIDMSQAQMINLHIHMQRARNLRSLY